MMRYLVFSDIHGNIEALEMVLEEIAAIRPDIVVSLGDVVGYGANPRECVDTVEEYAHIRVSGNHDLAAIGLEDSDTFNQTAKRAIHWTARTLEPRHHEMLERYDPVRRYGGCVFAHGSPVSPLDFEYIYTIGEARRVFEQCGEKFIFIGHTHIPGIISFTEREGCKVIEHSIVNIAAGSRYLINVGSIGQPRDGNAAASFAILDLKKNLISIRRVPYDIVSAQQKIESVGLPECLAMRLATAR
jgi:predicted phosphodiesterase